MNPQSDFLPVPRGQMRGRGIRVKSIHPQLLEAILYLQQTMEELFLKLMARHLQQDLALQEQRLSLEQGRNLAVHEREALLGLLMNQMVNFLLSGASGSLGLQLPSPSLDSRVEVEGGQRSQMPKQPPLQISDSETAYFSHDLSNRGVDISALFRSSFQDHQAYQRDKFHEDKNTLGFINLGISENKLCTDLMTTRLSQSDMNYNEDSLLQYPDIKGHPFLREEVARFLTYYCKAPTHLNPENVVVLNGCSSVFSALAMVLCDPGEALLIPTPFYGGFAFTSRLYTKVELVFVHLDSEVTDVNTHPFQLTVDKLEQGLREARLKGKKVRGLVLTNPQNPLGDIYSRDSLKEYLEFAKRYKLHVIIDEIYMLSVFDESTKFHSVLSMESLPDPNRTHVIWGTSKDFGISGFRFGTLYTHSKEVAFAVSSFGYLHSISGITQYKLCQLLRDREWIDKVYLPTNRSRLQAAHKYITDKLKTLKIPFLNRGSGLYVWFNLKKYLDTCTFEEELLLHRHFLDNKLIISCGKNYMCKVPGWFRLIFADKPGRLKLAMHRFHRALKEREQELTEQRLVDAMGECCQPPSQPRAQRAPDCRQPVRKAEVLNWCHV